MIRSLFSKNRRIVVIAALWPSIAMASDEINYEFDAGEYEKKTLEWGGGLSLQGTWRDLKTDSAVTSNNTGEDSRQELRAIADVNGRWDARLLRVVTNASFSGYAESGSNNPDTSATLRELYIESSSNIPVIFLAGKRLMKWGTGYAFNPVAFLERPKSADDPDAAREGLWLGQGTWTIGSLGYLQNISLSIMYVPVRSFVNDDVFSENDFSQHIFATRCYALIGRTDVDFYLAQGEHGGDAAIGADFATNISDNLEVHGEIGRSDLTNQDELSYLLGMRYLTQNEMTFFAEWLHRPHGLTAAESRDQFSRRKSGNVVNNQGQLPPVFKAKGQFISQNYFGLKASIKEPFAISNLTPSLNAVINTDDRSMNTIAKVGYVPIQNLDIQLSWQHWNGESYTQYGEYYSRNKLELATEFSF